jgi:hypothetical protein
LTEQFAFGVLLRNKSRRTLRALDKCGLCPHLKDSAPLAFSTFGLYLLIPALASTDYCSCQGSLKNHFFTRAK